jgi:hypothetical protein
MPFMPDQPPVPIAPKSDHTPEEVARVLQESQKLSGKMILMSVENSTAEVLLAAEMLIAFRAAGARMPLQELMDNILANMPRMYEKALKFETSTLEKK